jgi:hypothetical protein
MMQRLFFLFASVLAAQPALDAPSLAIVLDPAGRLTPIRGLAGNFLPGAPGPTLLAYSNDGAIEWRLEEGLLTATAGELSASYPTPALGAEFRGPYAILPGLPGALYFDGAEIHPVDAAPPPLLAGRRIEWRDGILSVTHPSGLHEELECPAEPSRLTAAAADWVHLQINAQPHLLRLSPGRLALFVLPLPKEAE